MKLFELLSGLRKSMESREYQIDNDPKTFRFSDLQAQGFSFNQLEHIRYLKPGEFRTLNGKVIRRVDRE
jgi:hypothetical protein